MTKSEQVEGVFNVVVSHQSDLSVDLENSAAHSTPNRAVGEHSCNYRSQSKT